MKKWILWIVALIFLLVCTWPSNGAVKGNTLLKEGQVKQISVTSSMGNYRYCFSGEDIKPIIDYISGSNLTPVSSRAIDTLGWTIFLEYEDGDPLTIHYIGDMYIRTQDGLWYRIEGNEGSSFGSLLYTISNK